MSFFDRPAWERILLLIAAQVIVPPLTVVCRRAAAEHPDMADHVVRTLALRGTQPAADVVAPLLITALQADLREELAEKFPPFLEASTTPAMDMPPDIVIEIMSSLYWHTSVVVLAFYNAMMDGYARPIDGPMQEHAIPAKNWRERVRKNGGVKGALLPIEGFDVESATIEQFIQQAASESLKKVFLRREKGVSSYLAGGRGRRIRSSVEMLREWMDRGTVGEGELATQEMIAR